MRTFCWVNPDFSSSGAANSKQTQLSRAALKCGFNVLYKCEEVHCRKSVYALKTMPGWNYWKTIYNNLHQAATPHKNEEGRNLELEKKLSWRSREKLKGKRQRELSDLFLDTWRIETEIRVMLHSSGRTVWRNDARLHLRQALHNKILRLSAHRWIIRPLKKVHCLPFLISNLQIVIHVLQIKRQRERERERGYLELGKSLN